MKLKVVQSVTFRCPCGSDNLRSMGAASTEDKSTYFVFQCEDCGEPVPVSVSMVILELFRPKGKVN